MCIMCENFPDNTTLLLHLFGLLFCSKCVMYFNLVKTSSSKEMHVIKELKMYDPSLAFSDKHIIQDLYEADHLRQL